MEVTMLRHASLLILLASCTKTTADTDTDSDTDTDADADSDTDTDTDTEDTDTGTPDLVVDGSWVDASGLGYEISNTHWGMGADGFAIATFDASTLLAHNDATNA